MATVTTAELRIIADLEALAAGCPVAVGAPFFARLRVRTRAGERELLLATRTAELGAATLIDWQAAPLAAALFGYQEGDDYELEHDGRELTGRVLQRQLVEFRERVLVAVEHGGRRLIRTGDGWHATELEPCLRPRPLESRARPLSPARVALDPVQAAAVRLPPDRSLLVLGEAGFGKTTVALHRLAVLARAARAAGDRFSALVIVPTPGLQRLVRRMLGELAVTDVVVETFERWVAAQAWRVFPALPRRLARDAGLAVTRLKRHPALRAAIARVAAGTPAMREVRSGYQARPETTRDLLLHLFGDRSLLEEVVRAAQLPASTIAEVLAHTRVQFSATSEQAFAHVDRARLTTLDGLAIDDGTPHADAGTIDAEDFAVVFALHRLITGADATRHGALARHDHVMIDEAQELAPIELELLGRAVAPGGTVTVAGDAAQQVEASTSFHGWPATMRELAIPDPAEVRLAHAYRCPPAIAALARHVLDPAVLAPADPAWQHTRHASRCHLVAALAGALLAVTTADPRISAAIVCRHAELAASLHARLAAVLPVRLVLDGDFVFTPGVDITTVREVKGLEFDLVIVPDLDLAVYPDDGPARRALYVALTRAVHQVWLAGVGPASPLVTAAGSRS